MGPTPSAHRAGVKGECKYIRGTDGQQFHPMLESGETLWLFEPDLCRSVPVTQVREVDIGGIPTHHYEAGREVFSMRNPNNYCYCPKAASCASIDNKTDSWDLSTCSHCMDGVFSTLGCQGAAGYGSAPHFLSADPSLRDAITGLNPNPELHTTFLNVEPLSGMAFQAHKRIQVSFPLEPVEKITILQKVSKVLLPVLWYDEGADITDEYIGYYYRLVQLPLLLVDVVTVLSLTSSSLVLVLVLANCVRQYRE